MIFQLTTALAVLTSLVNSAVIQEGHIQRRDVQGTATVNLALPQGTPSHLASGFIYGIPDTANQIPDSFYTDIGFRYTRAGGSQLAAPARGWVYGVNEFQVSSPKMESRVSKLTLAESICIRSCQLQDSSQV